MRDSAFLSYLTDADRRYVLDQGIPRSFAGNETILREGDPSDFLFVLLTGWVRVSTNLEDGREIVFGLRGPGDIIGELAGLTGWSRMASVRSIEPATVIQLTSRQLLASVRARPDIAIALVRTTAVRLRQAQDARVGSAAFDVSQRVAVYLVRMTEEHGRTVDEGILLETSLTQQDIANQVGASRRAVARTMALLRSRGVVSTGRKRIVVSEPNVLRSFAGSEPLGTHPA
jgi:CRP-like cAMP-binding protein